MAVVKDSMQNRVYQATRQYGGYIQLFHNPVFRKKAIDNLNGRHIINLSTGFNLRDCAPVLVDQLASDATNPFLYRNYEAPSGHPLWIQSVLAHEIIKSSYANQLSSKNIVVVAGSCVTFHYIARYLVENFDAPEVVAPVPTYAGFGENMAPFNIPVIEVVSDRSPGFMPTTEEVSDAITKNTKLIYTGWVNNPTGFVMDKFEAKKLLLLAKEKNVYLMWDETQSTLVSDECESVDMWEIASELDAWDNLIVVASMSKDRGIPSNRSAWVIGPEQIVQRFVEYNGNLYSMPATVLTGLVMKDLLFRSIAFLVKKDIEAGKAYDTFLDLVLKPLDIDDIYDKKVEYRFHQFLIPGLRRFLLDGFLDKGKVLAEYLEFNKWVVDGQRLFKSNFDMVVDMLDLNWDDFRFEMGGFNSFVHIPILDKVNQQKFVESMFVDAGIEILPGPAFGLQPTHWENQLGFWGRITLSSSANLMIEGLNRMLDYARKYR